MTTTGAAPVPPLGLGTSGRTGEAGFRAILTAIELGYRHLDTAQTYETEAVIGRALRACGVPREQMFLTTKIADVNLATPDFLPSLRTSLDRLGVDRADLTLIHWPSPGDAVPLADYMGSLAMARDEGLTRLIGVSNFPSALIDRAVALLGPGQIATNQVELHPFLQNRRLRACCAAHGITMTAYMPLAVGRVMTDPVLCRLGERHGEGAAAVALAWLRQSGAVAIPASSRREHLGANLKSLSLMLSAEEMAAIDALDRGERLVNPSKAPAWDHG
jgi:2,5-diketo-D-gluconate reductase B